MQSLAWRQAVFTLGMVVSGCLEAAVAFGIVGLGGVEGVVYSSLLCLAPGWLTIFAGELMRHRGLSAYVVIVGMAFRVLFVFVGFFVVTTLRHDLGFREFTVWLVVSYLVALVLETCLVVAPAPTKSSQ